MSVPSCVWVFVTPWTMAHQAPLSMGFSRQEYWNRLPFPTPGDLLTQGLNLCPLCLLHYSWLLDPLSHLESPKLNECSPLHIHLISLTRLLASWEHSSFLLCHRCRKVSKETSSESWCEYASHLGNFAYVKMFLSWWMTYTKQSVMSLYYAVG